MNYAASVSDFFQSPKWMMNLLLGGLCVLIPILGPMVVLGWLVTGFWARPEENFAAFPPFDFSQFDKYLRARSLAFPGDLRGQPRDGAADLAVDDSHDVDQCIRVLGG